MRHVWLGRRGAGGPGLILPDCPYRNGWFWCSCAMYNEYHHPYHSDLYNCDYLLMAELCPEGWR